MSRGTSIFKVMIDDVSLLVVKARIYMIIVLDFINPLMGTGNYSAHRII